MGVRFLGKMLLYSYIGYHMCGSKRVPKRNFESQTETKYLLRTWIIGAAWYKTVWRNFSLHLNIYTYLSLHIITVTTYWARWRLQSPTSRLFVQPLIQAQIKEHIKAPRHWPLWGESTGGQVIIWTNAGILLIGPLRINFSETFIKYTHFHSRKCIWNCRPEIGGHFVSASMC